MENVDRNPYDHASALTSSCYAGWVRNRLVLIDRDEPVSGHAEFVHSQFRSLVFGTYFACVAARAAVQQGSYRFGLYPALNTSESVVGLCRDLWTFVQEQSTLCGDFTSFIACFDGPVIQTEQHFEQLLWTQLQLMHEQDCLHHAWDATVSADPASPNFSYSFAGRAFFIVGLHPASSRWTRRFTYPTLVFNAHAQFQTLIARGQFQRLKQVIRRRDQQLQGTINPNLADFGYASDAPQYSGRHVEPTWQCPFQPRSQGDLT